MLQMKRPFGASIFIGILLFLACATVAFADTPVPTTPATPPSPAATASAPRSLTILGNITNGTPGGSLPVTMTVTLYAIQEQSVAFTAQATADASGKVRFDDVTYQPGLAYGLVTTLRTVQYRSDLTAPKGDENVLNVPLRIYETTADTSRLRVDEMYVAGQFLSADKLQVINAYLLTNDGDRTIEGAQKSANGLSATLRFYLPAGAENVEFQGDDGKKFSRTDGGFVTTFGVPPGTGVAQVVMRYTLPYTDQLRLETTAPYPVQKVTVLMADQGITLTGASLVDQGSQTGGDGVVRRSYGREAGLAAGEVLAFDVSGKPTVTAPVADQQLPADAVAETPQPLAGSKGLLLDRRSMLGGAVIAVGLLAVLVACIWQAKMSRPSDMDPMGGHRALFEALADLDEEHEAGKISDTDYADQREFLRAALLAELP